LATKEEKREAPKDETVSPEVEIERKDVAS
jgi:hypothetical protein